MVGWISCGLPEVNMAVLLAGLSALMFGAADFAGGMATRKSSVFAVLLYSQLIGLALAVLASFALHTPFPRTADMLWGIAAGVSGAVGLAALYTALATTIVAVASPIAAATGAAAPVLFGLLTGERPGLLSWIGIALAIPAIVLLSTEPADTGNRPAVRRATLLGVAAGLGFGVFFITISRTGGGTGLWPLVGARFASLVLMAAFAAATGRSLRLAPKSGKVTFAAGALDMGANIAFLLASRTGLLAVVAVISSLYPAPTVLLARIVSKERLTPARVAGLVLAVSGIACLSVS